MKLSRGPIVSVMDLFRNSRGAERMLAAGTSSTFVRNAIFICTSLGLCARHRIFILESGCRRPLHPFFDK